MYSTIDVCRILGIKRERLREWLNKGLITPTIKSTGAGVANIFSRKDIHQTALFLRLVEAGIKRDKAADYASQLSRTVTLDQRGITLKIDLGQLMAEVDAVITGRGRTA